MSQFVNANGNTLLNLKFSLEEQFTGMYWFDGKKYIRKVIRVLYQALKQHLIK